MFFLKKIFIFACRVKREHARQNPPPSKKWRTCSHSTITLIFWGQSLAVLVPSGQCTGLNYLWKVSEVRTRWWLVVFPLNNKKARELKRTGKKKSTSTWTSARAQDWEQMGSFNVKAVLIHGCDMSLGGRLDSSAWSWAQVTGCAGVLHVLCMSMWVSSFFPHPSSSKQVDCLQEIAPWSASCPG